MTATRTQPIIAVAAVLSLGFWFVEIERAFGLPAHPLLVHVPLVFIPILGLAVLAVAVSGRWEVPVAAFSVLTLAATLLAAGAGEAFLETRDAELRADPTMRDHADAGDLLRFTVFGITFALAALLFTRPKAARTALRVLLGLLALVALFYVVRVGHLGSEMAWGDPANR